MSARTCPSCGTELAAESIGGLCPKCVAHRMMTDPEDGAPGEGKGQTSLVGEAPVAQTSGSLHGRDFGDYELLELMGRGGMGVVYKARQVSLNRLVALKMIQNAQDASRSTLMRFHLEAEAAAKLEHPNIVPIYQIGEAAGQPFFSMKLIAGPSLAKKAADLALVSSGSAAQDKATPRTNREAEVRVATLIATVARAVHYAHQQGVIHRDLKPSNILLDANGEPQLTDFGIAKVLELDSGLTRTNDVLGTPAYMAPEQASGKPVSSAVDIYSLGAILYELLTGRPPFRGQTPLETMRKAAEEEPVRPTTLNDNVNEDLACICLKCLEKDPMHRYGSALALAEDLERWMRREPILARRIGPAARTVRWARRNPVGTSLILTLCAGLAGALGLLRMVNAEKNKTTTVLEEVRRAGQTNAQLLSLTVSMLNEQLEGLWLSTERRVLAIRSEQLAALSGLPIVEVSNRASVERFKFGLSANESPTSDARRYALLLSCLEQRLSEHRGRPVRFDLHIFKFKEDRVEALCSNGVDFARLGAFVYLHAKEEHPGIQALVEPEILQRMATFFTRQGTGIRTLADLKGRRVAFGDYAAGLTLKSLSKLADAGLTGRDLGAYTFFDSRTEFIEEVHELGYEAALKRRGWLHTTADVIESVLDGQYDAGVTSVRALTKNKRRGLVQIGGAEFERAPSVWVGRENLPPDIARDFTEAITSFQGEAFLSQLPDKPASFKVLREESLVPVRKIMQRVEGLFPVPPKTATTNKNQTTN